MIRTTKDKTSGLPEDQCTKQHKGNAICKRSDSYKNVEIIQPNNNQINNTNMISTITIKTTGLPEDLDKQCKGNAMYTRSDSYKNVEVMQPKNNQNNNSNMISTTIIKTTGLPEDLDKQCKGNAMHTRSDSYKNVEVMQPKNNQNNNNSNMISTTIIKTTGLPEDLDKQCKGNAIHTRSDSYKTVEAMQPNNSTIINYYDSLVKQTVFDDVGHHMISCNKFSKEAGEPAIVKIVKNKMGPYLTHDRVAYIEEGNDYYLFDLDRAILRRISSAKLEKYLRLDAPSKSMARCLRIQGEKIFIFSDKKFGPEILEFMNLFSTTITDTLSTFGNVINKIRSFSKGLQDPMVKILLLDVMNLMANVRDGYFTFSKVVTTIVSIYTLSRRAEVIFKPEMLEIGINDVMLLLASFGVPAPLLEKIKQYNVLSGKKLMDSNVVIATLTGFFEMILDLVKFMNSTFASVPYMSEVCSSIEKMLGYFVSQRSMSEVIDLYTSYVKNPQIMFDPVYRQKVMCLYEKCVTKVSFMEYVNNDNSRYTRSAWLAFESNVVKFAKNFDSSSRSEPICIVLEGGPGSGKSVLMNNVVELLRMSNMSVYIHTVPPIEAGKDFYDDYENQDVFVLDDVGQKGKSEWSFIINSVSPVKYPLQCASAEKKNTKFFNSKIIICTTNSFRNMQGFTKTDCISEPEALFRRAHVVDVKRANTEYFSQNISYYKFDYTGSKNWENKFLDINSQIDLPVKLDESESNNTLVWLISLIKSLEDRRDHNNAATLLNEVELRNILRDAKVSINANFHTAPEPNFESESWIDTALDVLHVASEGVFNASLIMSEWVAWMLGGVQAAFCYVIEKLGSDTSSLVVCSMSCLMFCCSLLVVKKYFLNRLVVTDDGVKAWRDSFSQAHIIYKKFESEAYGLYDPVGFNVTDHMVNTVGFQLPQQVFDSRKSSRLLQKCSDKSVGHCVISGKRVLAPAHYKLDGEYINIYQTWDHYENNHKEAEQVKVKVIKSYPAMDLAVYHLMDYQPLHKKCKNLFNDDPCKINIKYAVACDNAVALVVGVHVVKNTIPVCYDDVKHNVGEGWFTPLQGKGLCGTVLMSVTGNIEAMHVAGTAGCGFMIAPPKSMRKEIRELMWDTTECEFELDDKIIPNFSGVRLRYDKGAIDKKYPVGKTNYQPTKFHKDFNEDMYELCEAERIDEKGPPIIDKPIAKLEEMSMKTFMHQGDVKEEELSYIKKYLNEVIPEFSEISMEEAVFGCDDVAKLNKDSSNGYGCLKNKDDYFDFDNKVIKEIGMQVLNDFQVKCETDTVQIKDVICVEVFKDELRMKAKRTTPRTFRVMPMPHIVWMKKIFADMVRKLRKGMHEHGMCIGFNPYKDFDVLARKLKKSDVKCDADFGKWDGSLHVAIMKTIHEVFREKYRGSNVTVLDALLVSMYNSTVLVYDAVYRTTHGLPSGTWLTLVMNCIYNKCLTALVLFRNGSTKTEDVWDVVDYVTGDDKICGANGPLGLKFNAETIRDVSHALGMKCTNGDKTEITTKSRDFETLDYLKRKFVFHKTLNRYIGILSKDTILNTLQWYDSTSDLSEAIEGKCRSMQIESYLHGPLFYSNYIRIVEQTAPEIALFTEKEIIKILDSDDGYIITSQLAGKDISWMQ